MSELGPVSGIKRKSDFGAVGAAFDPLQKWGRWGALLFAEHRQ
jgi:hypothetical protein